MNKGYMNISEAINILRAEKSFKRTPRGRPITESAIKCVVSFLIETEDHEDHVIKCIGCGFVFPLSFSSLGCPNCGVEDLTMQIKE